MKLEDISCETCGACCKAGWVIDVKETDTVPKDLIYRGHQMLLRFDPNAEWRGSCAALNDDNRCSIYENRPQTCRAFKKGSNGCLYALRKQGIEVED
jgi:Fe-S-cluster containining protein